jgi:hypothetical protein
MNVQNIEERLKEYEMRLVQRKDEVNEGAGLAQAYREALAEDLRALAGDLGMIASGMDTEAHPELTPLATRMRQLLDEFIELRLRVLALVSTGKRGLDS